MRSALGNRRYPSKEALNTALLNLFQGSEQSPWGELQRIRAEHMEYLADSSSTGIPSVGSPFLAAATQAYFDAAVRVMIIGRETRGWDVGGTPFSSAQQSMEGNAYLLGNDTYSSPFWRAARRLSDELNPERGPGPPCLAWSNVYRLDERGTTPRAKLAKRLRASEPLKNLLRRELETLEPDVSWIACGAGGDWDLDQQLDGVGRTKGQRYQAINAPAIAPVVLRSDHPMGLTFKGKFEAAISSFVAESRKALHG